MNDWCLPQLAGHHGSEQGLPTASARSVSGSEPGMLAPDTHGVSGGEWELPAATAYSVGSGEWGLPAAATHSVSGSGGKWQAGSTHKWGGGCSWQLSVEASGSQSQGGHIPPSPPLLPLLVAYECR